MVTGLTVAREQEEAVVAGPFTGRPAHEEQERALERDMAMKVAVANSLLGKGEAKDALGLYKEVIAKGEAHSGHVAAVADTVIQEKEWTPDELLFGSFSEKQEKDVIKILLSRASTWLDQSNYDRAVETFEKVFLLDPLNTKASKGIDKARRRLIEEKEREEEVLLKTYEDENLEIIQMELDRARHALKGGSRSRARVHLDRALLVDPENDEARKLLRQLEAEA